MNHSTASHRTMRILLALCLVSIPLALMLFFPQAISAKPASVFNVNDSGDGDDITPGNNICETGTGNGICTLRAAITEANAHSGADSIGFTMDMTIVLTADLPSIIDDLSIGGPCQSCVTISGNKLHRVLVVGPGHSLYLANVTIANGSAVAGGGIYNIGGTLNITNTLFSNNNGGGANGGGILNSGTLNITNTVFYSNAANAGGGIYNQSVMNLLNTTLMTNTATSGTDGGGGIYNNGGTANITNATLLGNTASNKSGGGIYNVGTLNISNSTLSGNLAYSNEGGGMYQGSGTATLTNATLAGNISHYGGGMIVSGGDVTLLGSTVSGNTSNYGGAIFLNGGTATLSNSTLSANTSYQSGGGVYIGTGATLYFNNATIANNYSNYANLGDDGGGIKQVAGTVYIQNTILANNYRWNGLSLPIADDCKGSLNTADYNFIGTTTGCSFVGTTTHHKTGDPLLGPLQNNGGATLTHALLPGSPAIDAGNVSGCKDQIAVPLLTDQRGWHRPFGTYCDIGAYERGAFLYLPLILR